MGGAAQGDPVTQIKAVRVRKGLVEGLIMAEVYLPFDPQAFAELTAAVKAAGGDVQVVEAAQPELVARALDPIDTYGEAMLAEDLRTLAYEFMTRRAVDVQHDQASRATVQVVQSFINDEAVASPLYFPGAWVLGVKVAPGSPEWAAVEAGDLGAFSFQAFVSKTRVKILSEG